MTKKVIAAQVREETQAAIYIQVTWV